MMGKTEQKLIKSPYSTGESQRVHGTRPQYRTSARGETDKVFEDPALSSSGPPRSVSFHRELDAVCGGCSNA